MFKLERIGLALKCITCGLWFWIIEMTCIVGLIDKNKVYIGGDSCGVLSNGDRWVRKDPKVFKVGEFSIGYTTSFRMGQILRFKFKPSKPPRDNEKLYEYMVVKFVDELRKTFQKAGFGSTGQGNGDEGGLFLVGIRNRLFKVESNYQVAETADKFDSVGCGYPFALGSLESTGGDTPLRRILQALATAAKFHGGVHAPYRIINPDGKEYLSD